MKLPRRTAWASLAELDQVCTWVYTDEYDLAAQTLAVERVRSAVSPHAPIPRSPRFTFPPKRSSQPGRPSPRFRTHSSLSSPS